MVRISVPIFKLATLAQTLGIIQEGVNRIDRFFDEQPIPEHSQEVKLTSFDVIYDHVSFAYDENAGEVLQDVDFKASQGQITALVGPSGSGKSTLAQLLPRFWDVGGGAIRIGRPDASLEEVMEAAKAAQCTALLTGFRTDTIR